MLFQREPKYLSIDQDEEFIKKKDAWKIRFYALLCFSILTILTCVLYIFHFTTRDYSTITESKRKEFYSPAREHVTYTERYLMDDPSTPKFIGKPRPETDQAWHELLDGTLIKFSAEELRKAGNATSVAHKDGGYVGGLGISHNLHCVKRLKQFMNPDYYYSSESQNWDELKAHADHCLESIRLSLICQADWSIHTLKWTPHSQSKPSVIIPQPHVCVDWERLHRWMKSRSASFHDMVHP